MTLSEVESLFREVTDNELDEIGLFLKSITSIELRMISAEQEELIGRIRIEDSSGGGRLFTRGSEAREATFTCKVTSPSVTRTWRIFHSVRDVAETSKILSKYLPSHDNIADHLENDKLFSHVALAFPLDGTLCKGRLFTLLPLPIYTGFPLHLHGIMALTPDRQGLRNKDETGISPSSRER